MKDFMVALKALAADHGLTETILFDNSSERLPQCGIYFLFLNMELVYIGKSANIYTRLGGHHKDFDRVAVIEVAEKDLGAVEYALIGTFKPKHNGGI